MAFSFLYLALRALAGRAVHAPADGLPERPAPPAAEPPPDRARPRASRDVPGGGSAARDGLWPQRRDRRCPTADRRVPSRARVASLDPYGREPDAEANASCCNGRQRPRPRGRILSRSSPTRKRKLRGGVCVCCCAVCPGHRRAAHSPAPGRGPSGGHARRDPQPRVRPKQGSLLLILRPHSPSPGKARRVRSGGRALEAAAVIEPKRARRPRVAGFA